MVYSPSKENIIFLLARLIDHETDGLFTQLNN